MSREQHEHHLQRLHAFLEASARYLGRDASPARPVERALRRLRESAAVDGPIGDCCCCAS